LPNTLSEDNEDEDREGVMNRESAKGRTGEALALEKTFEGNARSVC
jgi:hypothetical protein